MKAFEMSEEDFEAIAKEIASEQSVVGIDAKKTHILILHLLMKMEERLARLEQQMASGASKN